MPMTDDQRRAKDRERFRFKTYGITEEQYQEMIVRQGNRCAICHKTAEENKQALAIDHCHDTGKVRGLLCMQCNLGIGYLNDNINLLADAIKYLNGFPNNL